MADDNIQKYSSKAKTLESLFKSANAEYSRLLTTLKGIDSSSIATLSDTSSHINISKNGGE